MKVTKLTPEQAEAYAEASGFPNTGEVTLIITDDELFNLYEALILPVKL
jgi:hypothetical protein